MRHAGPPENGPTHASTRTHEELTLAEIHERTNRRKKVLQKATKGTKALQRERLTCLKHDNSPAAQSRRTFEADVLTFCAFFVFLRVLRDLL
jgi:hypothetical protein